MKAAGFCLMFALLSVSGCGRTQNDGTEGMPAAGASNASGGSGNNGGSGGDTAPPPPDGDPLPDCTGIQTGPTPITALDGFELSQTLAQILPASLKSRSSAFVALSPSYAFSGQPEASIAAYHDLVHGLGEALHDDENAVVELVGCNWKKRGEGPCTDAFLEDFLLRVFRRPASDDDFQQMRAVFTRGQELGGDFESGVRAVFEVALQSPEFLYLVELGDGREAEEHVALSGYESAARLAYFATGQPPDAELLAAASAGELSADELEKQARRLVGSSANREQAWHLESSIWDLDRTIESDDPDYTPQLGQLLTESGKRFFIDITFDGPGTYPALFTQPDLWLNETIAPLFGFKGISGDDFRKVSADAKERAGLLTQPALFVATGSAKRSVRRALRVLANALCVDIPPPVAITPPPPEIPPGGTFREQLETSTAGASCQSCHRDLDPVGFAFLNYDQLGRYQTAMDGQPIDASGDLHVTDAAGHFESAVELSQLIAKSADGKACFARRWLEYAHGREASAEDQCTIAALKSKLVEGGRLTDLFPGIARADRFRYRPKSELAP